MSPHAKELAAEQKRRQELLDAIEAAVGRKFLPRSTDDHPHALVKIRELVIEAPDASTGIFWGDS